MAVDERANETRRAIRTFRSEVQAHSKWHFSSTYGLLCTWRTPPSVPAVVTIDCLCFAANF